MGQRLGDTELLSNKLLGFVQGAVRALEQRMADMDVQRLKWAEVARSPAEREVEHQAIEDLRKKPFSGAPPSTKSGLIRD
jgi:hypothetical protein